MVAVLLLVSVSVLLCVTPAQQRNTLPHCLTGYMTDVQSWVNERGGLTDNVDKSFALDMSNILGTGQTYMSLARKTRNRFRRDESEDFVKYLSLARCGLTRIPRLFDIQLYHDGGIVAEKLEYLTFYGNNFIEISVPGEAYDVHFNATDAEEIILPNLNENAPMLWSDGFHGVVFKVLKELDLRACGIQNLSPFLFNEMKALEALYLGENEIHVISQNTFSGLNKLLHLDISRNFASDPNSLSKTLLIEHENVFSPLESLKSIDFSHTKMNQRNIAALRNIGESLERISLCSIGSLRFGDHFLKSTNIKSLDVSEAFGVFSSFKALQGLESSLQVLYAADLGIGDMNAFENFKSLEILKLSRNEITTVSRKTIETLTKLQVLDLSYNRLSSWFRGIFSHMPSLAMLDVSNNNINIISEQMLADFANVSYVALSGNSLVCHCRSKDLIKLAARNELRRENQFLRPISGEKGRFDYHTGFGDVNNIIALRKNISYLCDLGICDSEDHINGAMLFSDYSTSGYRCVMMGESRSVPIVDIKTCYEEKRSNEEVVDLASGWNKLLILVLLPCFMLLLAFLFIFRKNLRYFCLTVRNSALISMVNKNKVIDDDTIFNYDVFVSYCNEDRAWVLDQLLNHLERECSVSLCLHERDFQVGLTILENIVSCMDRSKFIMLVISQQFLLSHWCQFEMHLAQHRLLETRREDLILVLLEEIPRRLRPNHLHYLMLTKTYIVWPKKNSEQPLFWKRLKRSIEAQKLKRKANSSLA